MDVAPGRHPSVKQLASFFTYGHLKTEFQEVSKKCHDVAEHMINNIEDSPELAAGLRKLLEAKDCFVRAMIDTKNKTGA